MIGRLFLGLANHLRAARLRAQMDVALRRRRAARSVKNARARAGSRTKIHEAYQRDPLINARRSA